MAQGKAALRSKLLPAGSVADQGLSSRALALLGALPKELRLYYSDPGQLHSLLKEAWSAMVLCLAQCHFSLLL